MQQIDADPASLSNRERILRTSIDLFAQKGFATVTTREIAAAVGIKAASIYNHFASKEAILDEIVSMFCLGLRERVHPAFDASQALDVKCFLDGVTHANDVFFSEPLNALIGVILMREQFQNERIRLMLLTEMIDVPRRMISAYFERLMQTGRMRVAESTFAAREYHAFFVYEFYASALAFGLREPDLEALAQRDTHLQLFLDTWAL